MMDRESIAAAMELELRHSVKILKAKNRIERDRTGWIDRFDLAQRNQSGVLYGDYMAGRFFGAEPPPIKTYGPWRGWSLQVRSRWLRPDRFRNTNMVLFQVGPFVLYGPGSSTCRT